MFVKSVSSFPNFWGEKFFKKKKHVPNHHPDLSCIVCEIPLPTPKKMETPFITPNSITTTSGSRTFNLRDFWIPQTWRRVFFVGGVFGDEKSTRKMDGCGFVFVAVIYTNNNNGSRSWQWTVNLPFFPACCFGALLRHQVSSSWTHFVWQKIKLHQSHQGKNAQPLIQKYLWKNLIISHWWMFL